MRYAPLLALLALGCSETPAPDVDAQVDASRPDLCVCVDGSIPPDVAVEDRSDVVDAGGVDVVDAPTPVDAPDVPELPDVVDAAVSADAVDAGEADVPGLDVAPDAAAVDAPDVQLADVVDAAGCDAALAVDPLNCGTCGNVCAGGTTCMMGLCRCASGAMLCDGRCVDTRTNNSNCGACGNACTIANTVCSVGRCACRGGEDICNGRCADLASDWTNCGACGTRCAWPPGGIPVCTDRRCDVRCDSGLGNCDGNVTNGCETDLSANPMHCGGCGMACSTAGATSTCATGRCVIQCNPGFANCDGTPSNGCEININTSVAHCGSCGGWCSPRHATPSCTDGRCGISACDRNYADCDGDVANGCEVPIDFSNTNCGRCGRVCPNGSTCIGGVCR